MKKTLITLFILSLSAINTACTSILPDAHKIDITQGNAIKKEQLDKLKTGITKKQVAWLLGTPLIRDVFHPNRWDYVYSFKPGRGEKKIMRLTLYFKGNILEKIDNINYEPES